MASKSLFHGLLSKEYKNYAILNNYTCVIITWYILIFFVKAKKYWNTIDYLKIFIYFSYALFSYKLKFFYLHFFNAKTIFLYLSLSNTLLLAQAQFNNMSTCFKACDISFCLCVQLRWSKRCYYSFQNWWNEALKTK